MNSELAVYEPGGESDVSYAGMRRIRVIDGSSYGEESWRPGGDESEQNQNDGRELFIGRQRSGVQTRLEAE